MAYCTLHNSLSKVSVYRFLCFGVQIYKKCLEKTILNWIHNFYLYPPATWRLHITTTTDHNALIERDRVKDIYTIFSNTWMFLDVPSNFYAFIFLLKCNKYFILNDLCRLFWNQSSRSFLRFLDLFATRMHDCLFPFYFLQY